MFAALNFLRQPDLLGMTVRVLLALFCGGAIGMEREGKRRPAGFRTHILICLGAAMTTSTSQYLYITMHYPIIHIFLELISIVDQGFHTISVSEL